jgi:hypothetical protein
MTDTIARPSNFCSLPVGSIAQEGNAEAIACNIMRILKANGNTFRTLPFSEYKEKRMTDGATEFNLSNEKPYFDRVVDHCSTDNKAHQFCSSWFDESN